MKFILHKSTDICIHSKEQIVYKVSQGFLDLTGYLDYEIIGKSIEQLSVLLKLNCQGSLGCSENKNSVFIFIKGDKPKEVIISSKYIKESKEWVYNFEKISNLSLDYILENIFAFNFDNKKSIAIYNSKDYILLESNKHYIDLLISLGIPVDNLIGNKPRYDSFLFNSYENRKFGYAGEVEFIDKNQCPVYFDISMITLYIDGIEKYILNIIYDVTDKVLDRKKIEKQKEQMSTILHKFSQRIEIFNKNGQYSYANKLTSDQISTTLNNSDYKNEEEVLDKIQLYTLDGNEIPNNNTPIPRVLRGEYFSNYRIIGTSNNVISYYEAYGMPIYDDNYNLLSGILIYEDITDKMIMEEYNIITGGSKSTFLNYLNLTYPSFDINYINDRTFKNLKDYNSNVNDISDVIGKNYFGLFGFNKDDELNLKNNIKMFIEEKSSAYIYTSKFIFKGEYKYYKMIYQPIYNQDNEIDRISIVGVDITEEEKSKEKLANTLKVQDEIFVNISHELKTPLNVIFSASQLLDKIINNSFCLDINNEIEYSNKMILQNCYRLTKLINNILDSSKIDFGFHELSLSNEDIVHVTEDIIESISEYTKEMDLKIVFDTEIEEKTIALDLYKYERIMLNLISNSIKFSKPKSTININIYSKNDYIEISVEDQGIGIAKGDLDIIFNKFQQVNKSLNREVEGTGIGLYLVKFLVELHKGEISVESVLGEGTKFILKLPDITVESKKINNFYDRDQLIKLELSDIYY